MSEEQTHNTTLSGDEARLLMMLLLNGKVGAPTSMTLSLYTRLNEISFAQPPRQNEAK